jgi:hypothetical protein
MSPQRARHRTLLPWTRSSTFDKPYTQPDSPPRPNYIHIST